jgi:hypothetical protein
VDPRAGLDDVEHRKFLTLPGLELRSQSLYRLRYPGSSTVQAPNINISVGMVIIVIDPLAFFLIIWVGLWVLRPLLAYCTSPR